MSASGGTVWNRAEVHCLKGGRSTALKRVLGQCLRAGVHCLEAGGRTVSEWGGKYTVWMKVGVHCLKAGGSTVSLDQEYIDKTMYS